MKEWQITSPVAIVRADDSIADCILRMKDRNIGAILVVSDDSRGELVGIFTERDLVKKVNLIQGGDHWSSPVRTVMTSPVKTITPSEISQAPELMLTQEIRHLPIVTMDEKGRKFVTGIISMRDLFHQFFSNKMVEKKNVPVKPHQEVDVLTNDVRFFSFIQEVFSQFKSVDVRRASIDQFGSPSVAIVDIDGMGVEKWPDLLKKMNHIKCAITVIYDPLLHGEKEIEILRQLRHAANFNVFQRPVKLALLLQSLTSALI